MNAQTITAPVGRSAFNHAADVVIVQNLLLARGDNSVGTANGVCGDATLKAITSFQSGFLRLPDGVVDPGGMTWRALSASYTGTTTMPPVSGDNLTRPVPRPAANTINIGLSAVDNSTMLRLFGQPMAGGYSSQCQPVTNPRLKRNMVLDSVGPFRVTGLKPAVESLKGVMADIGREQPAAYAALGTAGMLCCRLVRGSETAISNHSWGTAIDLTLNGVLDVYGNNMVQVGLTLIAPIFNRHGWFWGAAFRIEDGMHFEGGRALLDQWAQQLA